MVDACLLCGMETDNVYNAMPLCESCVASSVGAERALDATRERRYLAPDQVAELLFIGGVESMADREQLARDTGVRDAVVAAGKQLGGGYFAMEMQLDDSLEQDLGPSILDPALDLMERAHGDGEAVLVHCYSGISRSAAVVAAYLMRRNRWTLRRALRHMRLRHPQAHPNSNFVRQLQAREEEWGCSCEEGEEDVKEEEEEDQ